jgi:hypothetical protein
MSETASKFQTDYLSTSGVYKIPFTILILILQLLAGGVVIWLVNAWYINGIYFLLSGEYLFQPFFEAAWYYWLFLPLNVYGNVYLFAFSIIFFSAVIFKLLNLLSPPKEGAFERKSKDWKYAHRRFWTAYLPVWLARALPLPWLDIVTYRILGAKMGKNVVLYEGYVDPLFIKIGDFTMTSLNICIFSHLIFHDKLIIKRVSIGKACVVGPHSIISPGTILHDGAILGANSYTWIDQELEGDIIHIGRPASLKLPIQSVEESIKKVRDIEKEQPKEEDR